MAEHPSRFAADVDMREGLNKRKRIKLKSTIDTENIQVKLVSGKSGFNQVDKRQLSHYAQMWSIPESVYETLQYFTGEKAPYKFATKSPKRMFLTEMEEDRQNELINWIVSNKTLIISDIIKGRGQFAAEWVLVIQKYESNEKWILKNINEVMQHYVEGEVKISPRGSINIGRITVQRKGGDRGKPSANMLQFKLNPITLFDI